MTTTFHVAPMPRDLRSTIIPTVYHRPMILIPPGLSANATYLFWERIGLLCEDKEPTPEQLRIATLEAREWDLNHPEEE